MLWLPVCLLIEEKKYGKAMYLQDRIFAIGVKVFILDQSPTIVT